MPSEFSWTRRVEFADTDTAGVAHFSVFFRYMEEAEHAFYRSLGSSAYRQSPDGVEGMPRVAAECRYFRPVRYDDEVVVHLIVREMTKKSIGYEVVFRLASEDPVEVARGAMTVVHVARSHGEADWSARDLPAELLDQIEVAPAE